MTRLIDADALKKSIEELKRSPWFNSVLNLSWHAGIKEALEIVETCCIDKEPTIDAVPVIRCKDCKYYPYGIRFCIDSYEHCSHMTDDGFCSWAVRKETS